MIADNKITLSNQDETKRFAAEFSKSLKKGDIVELQGDLGSGKTFFVRALSEALGAKGVSSPSFVIKNEYMTGKFPILHFDFYRFLSPAAVSEELKEDLEDQESLILIEWAETVQNVLPSDRYRIHFKVTGDNSRELTLYK
jgi:tRNA threonylcarbamoyladenosine biosynthesis protein TsaE